MNIVVKQDDATSSAVVKLLESHLIAMKAQTPPMSVHALDLSEYRSPSLTLWTAWAEGQLVGCGALQDLGQQHGVYLGEIKSMRTKAEFSRTGVGNAVLCTILEFASQVGMQRASLETGATEHFKAAHAFYEGNGFTKTAPFGTYTNDPHSVFLYKRAQLTMISAADVLAYAIALGLAAGLPGPGMTALVARSVSGGTIAGYAMLTGLIIGDLVFLTLAVFGLGLLSQTFGSVFTIIRWLSVSYLMYLAWQFWTAERHEITTVDNTQKTLLMAALTGLAITLGNPKAIAFYIALLPLVLDLNNISVSVLTMVLAPVAILVLFLVGSIYILGAISVRRALSSAKAQRQLHRTAALAMAGAAVSIVAREL